MNYKNLLQKYLTGEMTEQEKVDFEKALVQNEALQNEFLSTITPAYTTQHLRKNIQSQITEESTKSIKSSLFYWMIAASIVLIISFAFFFQNGLFDQGLDVDYYAYYPSSSTVRGNDNEEHLKAFVYYEKGEYQKALEEFQQYPKTPEYMLYKGICLLHLEEISNIKASISYFEQVLHSNTNLDETAEWFLALAYLQAGEKRKAKPLLEKISTDRLHFNYLKALELLESNF